MRMKLKGKASMKIERIRPLTGPNVYSYRPVLLMRLDLGELVERESREFKGFNEQLLTILPGIENHHCSLGRPGGFVTRLNEGGCVRRRSRDTGYRSSRRPMPAPPPA